MAKQKIVLAYSGGLDTSIIIPWLKENYDCTVIAVAADVGQGEELEPLHEKAKQTGAEKLIIADLKDEFVTEYIWPTLKAGAMYENTYLLGTSMARPVIAKALVDVAHAEGATAIAHGCTGKGNDQVRFELTIKALDPSLKIIAPWRIWDIKSREEEIDYAVARGIPVPVSKDRPYSMDRNLWHLSHEGADLEDPANAPPDDLYLITRNPKDAPDEEEIVSIGFEKGVPVSVNGEPLAPVALIEKLNQIGAQHGVGIDDMVENRLVGMKSRGVYENPAGTMLYTALKQLESICLDRDTLHYKQQVALRYSELVYNGQWFTPLREGLDAFINSIQSNTTGESKLKLYKGRCYNAGVTSPYSLYNPEFATFGEDAVYNQKDAEGFINLFGLPITVAALMRKSLEK
ncbi:MAG: argininosuccinate synthase [Christensenellales bacterium]|jgi:argininosuccinate synthase